MENIIQSDTEVLVVGAGLSGLIAANELFSRGFDILIIEAQGRVGGRTLSVPMKTRKSTRRENGHKPNNEECKNNEVNDAANYNLGTSEKEDVILMPFDIGGQWVNSSQTHIMTLLAKVGVNCFSQSHDDMRLGVDLDVYNSNEPAAYNNNRQIGILGLQPYKGILPSLRGVFSLVEMARFVRKVEKLCKNAVLGEDLNRNLSDLEGLSAGDLIRNNLYSNETRKVLLSIIQNIHGADPDQISALYFLTHANAGGGFLSQCKASLHGENCMSVEGGAQKVSEILYSLLGPKKIIFGEPVTTVVETERRVFVKTLAFRKYSAKNVVVAIPPKEILKISFRPPLSDTRLSVLHHLLPGKLCKFVATYEKAFWKEMGFSGDVITYGTGLEENYLIGNSENESMQGQLAASFTIFDCSSESHGAALTGVLASEICQYWLQKEASERRRGILNGLAQLFGPQALYPVDFAEKDWTKEPFTGNCSTYLAAVGSMENYSKLAECHGRRVYFAGSETASSWPGYMNGAVQAGQRAACEIIYALSPDSISTYEVHEHILNRRAKATHRWRDEDASTPWLSLETYDHTITDFEDVQHDDYELPMPLQLVSHIKLIHLPVIILCSYLITRFIKSRLASRH